DLQSGTLRILHTVSFLLPAPFYPNRREALLDLAVDGFSTGVRRARAERRLSFPGSQFHAAVRTPAFSHDSAVVPPGDPLRRDPPRRCSQGTRGVRYVF